MALGSNALGSGEVQADWRIASDDYFKTLSIPQLRGRSFDTSDGGDTNPPVVILSDGLARRFWPNEDAVGREVRLGNKQVCRVVGVVGDIHNVDLTSPPNPTMYFPTRQTLWPTMSVVVRSSQGTDAASIIRRQVATLDPELAVFNVRTMTTMLGEATAQPRLTAWLVGLFAIVALLLAAIGVYGVLAYLVAQRTQEIGVRMALGASAGSVVQLVLGHALRLTGVGIGIGMAGAAILGPFLASLLFGIGPRDAVTFAGVALGLVAIAVAGWVRARAPRHPRRSPRRASDGMSSRLVVFDLDGTLIDSQQDLADAANALIVELGGQPVAVEAIGRMVGDGAAVLVRRALAATGVHVESVRGALDRFLVLYDERLLASTRLYDGMAEAIDAFADVARLAVLTNKPERATRRILEGLAIAERFDWVIGGDGPFPRKPDPAGLQHLVAQAGVSLDRSIMIGDSSVDLATARAAGYAGLPGAVRLRLSPHRSRSPRRRIDRG